MTNHPFTMVDNRLVEYFCKTKLGNYESRVLVAIARKTWGFQKKIDWISESQISKMTRIDRRNVHRAIKSLTKRRLLIKIGNKMGINCENLPSEETASSGQCAPSHEMTAAVLPDNNLSSAQMHTINKKENNKERDCKALDALRKNLLANHLISR